jgi:Reverse transcriptase (RNA-dependent DNA polymerase)
VLLLKKAIYGLVQATRPWGKKFKEAMAGCNYFPNKADPCLFIEKANGDETLSFVIIYVDHGRINGTPEAIKEVIEALSKSFKVKNMGEMNKFVGCHIIDTTDKVGVWIHQPKLLKNLMANFKDLIEESARVFKTPSASKSLIIRPEDGDPLISPENQKNVRMGVGMLLSLVKHARPNISTSVRELSRVEDGATDAHFKALLCTMNYVLGTGDHGLLLQPKFTNDGFYL